MQKHNNDEDSKIRIPSWNHGGLYEQWLQVYLPGR